MPELAIRKGLWDEFVELAKKKKQKPETLAVRVLRDYVKHCSDEELLERSSTIARQAEFRMNETEDVVRQYRQRKGN